MIWLGAPLPIQRVLLSLCYDQSRRRCISMVLYLVNIRWHFLVLCSICAWSDSPWLSVCLYWRSWTVWNLKSVFHISIQSTWCYFIWSICTYMLRKLRLGLNPESFCCSIISACGSESKLRTGCLCACVCTCVCKGSSICKFLHGACVKFWCHG